jgi:glycosyltransferase involved in cell wall biosynthesis
MTTKVLHLLSGLEIGGMERAVLRLASRGRREGMDHALLLFDTPFRCAAVDFHPGGVMTEFLRRRPGVDLGFAVKLARKLACLEVDVVHAHNDTAIFYSALAIVLARLAKIRLIGTFRTRPARPAGVARWLTCWAAGRAGEILAVSDELSAWLVRHRWVGRCATIWNGADLAEFSPVGDAGPWRRRFAIPEGAILVGHVGRFAAVKRHADLFAAALALRAADPPVYFLLAGDGPLFQFFQRRAAELPNLFLLSNITDVAAFLRCLDIFVLCSEHEGAPQALLEAMACGCAILATRVGGIPHLLAAAGPAPCGRLVPPRSPVRLAEEIRLLAQDAGMRRRLAGLAGERAKLFSFDREWGQYAALYSTDAGHPLKGEGSTGSTSR